MSVRVKMKWHGRAAEADMQKKAARGLFEAAEYVLEQANRTVPHDEGTLQASGETSLDEGKLMSAVSYDTPYAKRLHEHPEYKFQKGRRGKWLEQTMNEQSRMIPEIIAKNMK